MPDSRPARREKVPLRGLTTNLTEPEVPHPLGQASGNSDSCAIKLPNDDVFGSKYSCVGFFPRCLILTKS